MMTQISLKISLLSGLTNGYLTSCTTHNISLPAGPPSIHGCIYHSKSILRVMGLGFVCHFWGVLGVKYCLSGDKEEYRAMSPAWCIPCTTLHTGNPGVEKSKKIISLNIAILVRVKTDLVRARLSMEGSIIKN